MANGERKWNVAHVIAGLLLVLCTIAGVGLRLVWETSSTITSMKDHVQDNSNSNKTILNEVKVLSSKVDNEHDSEEQQFGKLDHRLTRVETSLGIKDGN